MINSEQIPTEYMVLWIMAAPLFATTTTTTTENNSNNNNHNKQQQQQKRGVQQPQQQQQNDRCLSCQFFTAVSLKLLPNNNHLKIVQGSEGCERLHPVSTLAPDVSWRFFQPNWWEHSSGEPSPESYKEKNTWKDTPFF